MDMASDGDLSQPMINTNRRQKGKLCLECVDLLGKESQAQALRESLARVRKANGKAEAALICGYSGTGKSLLATTIVNEEREKLLFASGKYDQNDGVERPFSAIADALAALCKEIKADEKALSILDNLADNFCSNDIRAMGVVAPEVLELILIPDDDGPEQAPLDTALLGDGVIIRFTRLFRKFLATIATPSVPVVLFLDDLQWVDDSSRKVLTSFFKDQALSNILLIGAIREEDGHSFEVPRSAAIFWQKLVCDNLQLKDVRAYVANTTGWSDVESEDLSKVVYNRTAGNPYFVKNFMEEIFSTKLLRFDSQTEQFVCNVEAVSEILPSSSVVDLLVQRISSLKHGTQLMLVIAAALGHTFHWDVLEPVMASLELISLFPSRLVVSADGSCEGTTSAHLAMSMSHHAVMAAISESCGAGLLEPARVDGQYRFTHDRVQQTALSLLPKGKTKDRIKATLGAVILELSNSKPSEFWLRYTATNLLVKNRSESHLGRSEVGRLCLGTARIASTQAAFRSAAKYADAGIKALGDTGWNEHYELRLQLSDESAKNHFSCGNLKTSKRRAKAIVRKVKNVEDRIPSYLVTINTLLSEEKFEECIVEGVKQIQSLGVRLSRKSSLPLVLYHLVQTKRIVGRTGFNVLELPQMTDKKIETVNKLLFLVGMAGIESGDEHFAVICSLKMFQLTLKYGISEMAIPALSLYALVLSFQGSLESASRWSQVTASLGQSYEVGWPMGAPPMHMVCWHLKNPLKESPDVLAKAATLALSHGDAYHASLNTRFLVPLGIFVKQKSLHVHEGNSKKIFDAMTEYKQKSHLAFVTPWSQLIENMRGNVDDQLVLKGTFMDEAKVMTEFQRNNNPNNRILILVVHHARLVLLYLCREHVLAEDDRKQNENIAALTKATYIFNLTQAVFAALNCYALAITTGRKKYVNRACRYVKTIKYFGKAGSPNIPPLLSLMHAEVLTFRGKYDEATQKYQEAISGLRNLEFYLLEAIATERMAESVSKADPIASRTWIIEAYRKYSDFGLTIKLPLLVKAHGHIFPGLESSNDNDLADTGATQSSLKSVC